MPLLIDVLQTSDEELRRVQSKIAAAVNPVLQNELLGGRLTDEVTLTTSFQNIPHLLGRVLFGWLVVSPNANATIWQDVAASNPDSTKYLRVRASAAVTVRFWVF